jgi:hypothetical protein
VNKKGGKEGDVIPDIKRNFEEGNGDKKSFKLNGKKEVETTNEK